MVSGHRSRSDVPDHDELLALAEVAQQYYLEDLTQEQIARRRSVSRSNVSRMLKVARERGVVEIRVHHPLRTLPEMQDQLKGELGLHDCFVLAEPSGVSGGNAPRVIARQIGALGARYLQENLPEKCVIGVGWGTTVYQVVSSGYLQKNIGSAVVQLMGSVGGATPDIDGAQIASHLGSLLGSRVYYLHAPMVVTDAGVRRGLLRDQHIRKTFEMARQVDALIVSVGAVSEASGLFRAGYLNDADLDYIRGQGAVGDICGSYYKQDGTLCALELDERTVAAPPDVMRGALLRVGVGWGTAKALPSLGAIRAGLINVLITDEASAREMLWIIDREQLDRQATALAASAK